MILVPNVVLVLVCFGRAPQLPIGVRGVGAGLVDLALVDERIDAALVSLGPLKVGSKATEASGASH